VTTWSIGYGPRADTVPSYDLSKALSRKYARHLDRPDELTHNLSADWPAIANLAELATDAWVYREGVAVSRLRLMPSSDTLDTEMSVAQFGWQDYRSLLDYRNTRVGDALTFTATDQAAIVWSLISLTQARTNGSLGITKSTDGWTGGGVANTGILRDRTYDPDVSLGKLLDELAAVDQGFDWWIGPDLKIHVYYPGRGSNKGVILDYGGNVSKVSRTFSPGSFANDVAQKGSQELTTAYATSATIATDPRGRWEFVKADATSVLNQTVLQQKAAGLLTAFNRPQYGWKITLREGRWTGFAQIDVGDTVRLVIRRPYRFTAVDEMVRVVDMDIAIGDSGEEIVDLAVEEV
jgi:hypothetical protein